MENETERLYIFACVHLLPVSGFYLFCTAAYAGFFKVVSYTNFFQNPCTVEFLLKSFKRPLDRFVFVYFNNYNGFTPPFNRLQT